MTEVLLIALFLFCSEFSTLEIFPVTKFCAKSLKSKSRSASIVPVPNSPALLAYPAPEYSPIILKSGFTLVREFLNAAHVVVSTCFTVSTR